MTHIGVPAVPVCGDTPPLGPQLALCDAKRLPRPHGGHGAKFQLDMAIALTLDTHLRNGHASDQAQVTVLRTLVRYISIMARNVHRRRVEVSMTAPPSGSAEARTAFAS